MYRAIKEVGKPITFAEIWNEIYRSVSNKTEGKTPKATLSVILQKMVKDGYVKRSEVQEAKAVAA
jgi:DNA-binding PadR family transcriptional regulator